MAQEITATDGSGDNHAAAELETIVVDPEDVLDMMRRNYRDENQSHTHVLRVTPPLEDERKASLHVSDDHAHYPADVTAPIHLDARMLLKGDAHKPLDGGLSHPDHTVERGLFRDEYELHDAEDLPEDEWDEWWDVAIEIWESQVRAAMREPREIELGDHVPEHPSTTVEVRFEETDE